MTVFERDLKDDNIILPNDVTSLLEIAKVKHSHTPNADKWLYFKWI